MQKQKIIDFTSSNSALLLENVHESAQQKFMANNIMVSSKPSALKEDELLTKLGNKTILGIRSNTQITPNVLKNAPNLHVIGTFCIGTNQVDLKAAAAQGVAVFNAPFSNTRSVVELVFANMLYLNRNLLGKVIKTKQGIWQKGAKGAKELRGKTLGIIGYGNIGSQLSVLAESFGLRVIYYDVADKLSFGNAIKAPVLEYLLAESDIVSVHVDGRPENKDMINKNIFQSMKKGAIFINTSRGLVVSEPDLADALKSKHLAGAALDVYKIEPKTNGDKFASPLQKFDNVILTPHVGSGTEEAQNEIGIFVSNKLCDYLHYGDTSLSVNLPNVSTPHTISNNRIGILHQNVPGMLAKINNLIGEKGVNITAQWLNTKGSTGYVVIDYKHRSKDFLQDISTLPEVINIYHIA